MSTFVGVGTSLQWKRSRGEAGSGGRGEGENMPKSLLYVGLVAVKGHLDLAQVDDKAAVAVDGVCLDLAGVLRGEHGKKRGEEDRGNPHA